MYCMTLGPAPSTHFKYDFIPFTFPSSLSTLIIRMRHIILTAGLCLLSAEFCMNGVNQNPLIHYCRHVTLRHTMSHNTHVTCVTFCITSVLLGDDNILLPPADATETRSAVVQFLRSLQSPEILRGKLTLCLQKSSLTLSLYHLHSSSSFTMKNLKTSIAL